MANTPMLESQLHAIAATWNRATAVDAFEDTKGIPICRFEFASPYETDEGRVFDSALVWYSKAGAVDLVKRGLKANMAREAEMLQRLLTRRR